MASGPAQGEPDPRRWFPLRVDSMEEMGSNRSRDVLGWRGGHWPLCSGAAADTGLTPTPEAFLTLADDTMQWQPWSLEIADYEDEIAAFTRMLREHNPKMRVWADEINWLAPGQPPRLVMGDQGEPAQAKYSTRFFPPQYMAGVSCRLVVVVQRERRPMLGGGPLRRSHTPAGVVLVAVHVGRAG